MAPMKRPRRPAAQTKEPTSGRRVSSWRRTVPLPAASDDLPMELPRGRGGLTMEEEDASPTTTSDSPLSLYTQRADSFASTNPASSTISESSTPPRRSPGFGFIKSSPTVNAFTTCGRHTDQLLFSGPSLSGFARAFFKRK